LVTGGSDFHGMGDDHGDLGCMTAVWTAMDADARALLQYAPEGLAL
jgi:hypothetical protein